MTKSKLVRGGAFALALAGGAVAGATLGVPTISGAQDEPTTTEAPTAGTPEGQISPDSHPFRHRGERLEKVAEIIGIDVDELRTALQEGQSIAEVAEANGVDPQTVVDALVESGTERLEEATAALPDRVQELVDKDDWGDCFQAAGRGFPGRGHRPGVDGDEAGADEAA